MYSIAFPETDPRTYKGWLEEGWHDQILDSLEYLLHFVRRQAISGLAVGGIRRETFVPFGGPDRFNRRASLLLEEIEAYNDRWKSPVDEQELEIGWKLSGFKRP